MTPSIFWYDLETTGTDTVLDRPLQFAGIRTDLELKQLDEPVSIFCKPGNDILPDPGAIAVTGINMLTLQEQGWNETDFARQVREQLTVPETCMAGFNNLRFDDEMLRQSFYRNFHDPYEHEWRHGNSRWDLIDVMRTACALRPAGLDWPRRDDGSPGFRLEELTAANGIAHDDAHDALADVQATIDLARRVRQAQPRLFDYLFKMRGKQAVLKQLYPLKKKEVLHISGIYPASQFCAGLILPLCQHPTNSNGIICMNLMDDPSRLIDANAKEINRLALGGREQLGEGEQRLGLKTIQVNRCPALVPVSALDDDVTARRLGIDKAQCQGNLDRLLKASGLVEKIQDAWQMSSFAEPRDVDFMLYSGFIPDDDRALMIKLHETPAAILPKLANSFKDDRLNDLLFRYRARNYPNTLDAQEQASWESHRQQVWQKSGRLQAVNARLAEMLAASNPGDSAHAALKALEKYLHDVTVQLV